MFDEEIAGSSSTGKSKQQINFSSESEDSDDEYDEMDDQDISKLVIITQTPPVNRKVRAGTHEKDHTGVHLTRSKITSDLAQAINDGLYYYEQDLRKPNSSMLDSIRQVDLVSQEEFNKLKIETEVSDKPVASAKKTIQREKSADKKPSFGPSSLTAESTSFKQLMTHVNSIKTAKAPQASGNSRIRRDSCINFNSNLNSIDRLTTKKKKNERFSGNYPTANSRFYPVVKDARPAEPGTSFKKRTRHSKNPPVESHVGWVLDRRQQKSRSRQRSCSFGNNYTSGTAVTVAANAATNASASVAINKTEKPQANGFVSGITPIADSCVNLSSSYSQSQDLQPFHHPSYTLLHSNGFTQQLYGKFRKRCLSGKLLLRI